MKLRFGNDVELELPRGLMGAYRRLGSATRVATGRSRDTSGDTTTCSSISDTHGDETAELYEKMARTIVASFNSAKTRPSANRATKLMTSRRCKEPLEDIVDGSIRYLVRNSAKYKQRSSKSKRNYDDDGSYGKNILSMGYAPAREGIDGSCVNMAQAVYCVQPNSTASHARKSALTKAIHSLVGDDVMRDMLTQCIVLIPAGETVECIVRRGNYFQLCGPPLTYFKAKDVHCDSDSSRQINDERKKRKRNDSGSSDDDYGDDAAASPPRKLQRCDGDIEETGVDGRPAEAAHRPPMPINPYKSSSRLDEAAAANNESRLTSDADTDDNDDNKTDTRSKLRDPNAPIPRHLIFYSESFVQKVGLPPSHILNLNDDGKEHGGVLERLLDSMVRLRAPSDNATGTKKKKRSTKRHKRWKRLRGSGIRMCREIRRRHSQCDYARLLEHHCPLPSKRKRQDGHNDSPTLPELSESHASGDQAASFVTACLSQAFPNSFWGSRHNFDTMSSTVSKFMNLRRREQLPEKEVTKGIRVTDIKWLFGEESISGSRSLTRSDHEAATTLLQSTMHWLYCSYIIPLIRSCFYATETEFTANRVVFYRKPVWKQFRTLAMAVLNERQYSEIDITEAARRNSEQSMGCSKLRLLPKPSGVRALNMLSHAQRVNFGQNAISAAIPRPELYRLHPEDRYLSTNTTLRPPFDVLKHEHDQFPTSFGCGVFGFNEVFPLLLNFAKDLDAYKSSTGSSKEQRDVPLYFVSVDLHRCYDNIDQTYLYDLVKRVISDDEYMVHRHNILHPFQSMDKVQRKRSTQLCRPEVMQSFPDLAATELAGRYSNSIFIDGVSTSVAKKKELLELLKEHIFSNLVAINGDFGPRFLSQASGIPQGSVLSTILCNYYYGDLESRLLGDLFEPAQSRHCVHLLVRIVDDFLLLSTDKGMCTQFLEKMRIGIPDLGVMINQAKTRVSFDYVTTDTSNTDATPIEKTLEMSSSGDTFFSWCGMLLNTKSCEVRVDYVRFARTLAVDGLTVDRLGGEGTKLLLKMKSFVRPRCQPMLFDLRLHAAEHALFNFYQMMLLAAIKTVGYIRTGLDDGVKSNQQFIVHCINDVISYAQAVIGSRLRSAPARDEYAFQNDITSHQLSKEATHWLGRHAFRAVLKTVDETQGYEGVIRSLGKGKGGTTTITGKRLDYALLCKVANKALQEFHLQRFEY